MSDLITRYLGALSTIQVESESEEVNHYYIYQHKDGSLVRKFFLRDWSLPDFIGPAKPGTSVACCLGADLEEILISLNESNVLQDYKFDPDDEEWMLGRLSDQNFVAAPNTKMSITKHEGDLHLYYQKDSGAIQELILSNTNGEATWKASEELSVANPVKDSSISAVTTDGTIRVFYVHLDGSIHQCLYEKTIWTDNSTGTDKIEDGSLPTRIAASFENNNLNVFYRIESGDVIVLEGGGGRRKIGTMGADGVFLSTVVGGEERFMANVFNAQICVIT